MPDLVNPEQTGGKKTYIVWKDEICASCLNQKSCALIQVMHRNTILTHSGLHVSNCDDYNPDESSPYYIAEEEDDFEKVAQINLETLQQKMDALRKALGKLHVLTD